MIRHLEKETYTRLILILFILFSFWSTLINTYLAVVGKLDMTGVFFTSRTGTSMGFNIANFTMLYLIGGYLRFFHEDDCNRFRIPAVVFLLLSSIIATLTRIYSPKNFHVFFYYDSIIIFMNSITFFVLFLGMRIRENPVIIFMGKNTFGTYLVHIIVIGWIQKIILIEKVVRRGFLGAIESIAIFVIGGYILSLIISSVISFIFSPINKCWKNTKLYNYYIYK